MGEHLDKAAAQTLGPGGFYAMPAGMRHFGWTEGETIAELTGIGPIDVTYVDAKDAKSQ
jgi:hypothetical protein